MLRRDFVRLMAAAVPGASISSHALFADSADTGWRTYEVTTSIEVLNLKGRTRVWLPQPLTENAGFQNLVSSTVHCEGGKTAMHEERKSGLKILTAEFPEGRPATLTTTQRVKTRDWSVRLGDGPIGVKSAREESAAEFLKPTHFVPVDGIVKKTSDEITRGATTDVDKVHAIYEWVVENTHRDPKVRGCGRGDIRAMLEMGDLSGKCADLNAMFVGLVKAAGVPARDVYGIRIGKTKLECKSLGTSSDRVEKAQHCRAEVYLTGYGWVPMDPADVRKVVLEEPPGNLAMTDSKVVNARKRLFGSWEMNWMAYNYAQDVALPGSDGPALTYFMYPQAETKDGRVDSLDPENFRYQITSREVQD